MIASRDSFNQSLLQKGWSILSQPWRPATATNHGMTSRAEGPSGNVTAVNTFTTFYCIDRDLGLCYLCVPTWPAFRLHFNMNGYNWLASKIKRKGPTHKILDNCFVHISDWQMALKSSERINPEDLHKALDIQAKRYWPVGNEVKLCYQ